MFNRPARLDRLPVSFADADAIAPGLVVAGRHEHLAFFVAIVSRHAHLALDILPSARTDAHALADANPPAMFVADDLARLVYRFDEHPVALGLEILIDENGNVFSAINRFDPDLGVALFVNRFNPHTPRLFATDFHAEAVEMVGLGDSRERKRPDASGQGKNRFSKYAFHIDLRFESSRPAELSLAVTAEKTEV
jgi:hypothetical protein